MEQDFKKIIKKSPFSKKDMSGIFVSLPEARKKRNYEKFKNNNGDKPSPHKKPSDHLYQETT